MLTVSDYGAINSVGVHKTTDGIKIWGSIAPKIMRKMFIPQIVGPTPSLIIGSDKMTKFIFQNGIVQMLYDNNTLWQINTFDEEPEPIRIASDVCDMTHDVYLIDYNKLVFPKHHTRIKLYTEIDKIYPAINGVFCVSKDADLWFVGLNGIAVLVHRDVRNIKEGNDCLYFFCQDNAYLVYFTNPTISIHLDGLSEFTLLADNLALSSTGEVMHWNEYSNIDNCFDIPTKIINIHSYKGSYFAEDIEGKTWVWGYNINQRLGLNKTIEYVEEPILNKYI